MALSVEKNIYGPTWPLGLIVVSSSGTPVRITSLVDSAAANAPETANTSSSTGGLEYTPMVQQVIFRACKSINPYVANAGAIYLLQPGSGTGNKTDSGAMVQIILPGEVFTLSPATQTRNLFNLYQYYLDADTSADGALVCAVII